MRTKKIRPLIECSTKVIYIFFEKFRFLYRKVHYYIVRIFYRGCLRGHRYGPKNKTTNERWFLFFFIRLSQFRWPICITSLREGKEKFTRKITHSDNRPIIEFRLAAGKRFLFGFRCYAAYILLYFIEYSTQCVVQPAAVFVNKYFDS